MIFDVENVVIDALDKLLDAQVLEADSEETPNFPTVTVEEKSNINDVNYLDSGGFKLNDVVLEVSIYSNTQNPKLEIKTIRKQIDSLLNDTYGMERILSEPIPNFADLSVSRWVLRYAFKIDKDFNIYRR